MSTWKKSGHEGCPGVSRRRFVRALGQGMTVAAVGGVTGGLFAGDTRPLNADIMDTHVHFYDPTRKEGVPWPPREDAILYRKVYPETFQQLKQPRPVRGVVVVEASEWLEDNQWILDLAGREKLIAGFVGNLPAGTVVFKTALKRFAQNKLFRGVRVREPELLKWHDQDLFLEGMKQLSDGGLSLDVVGSRKIMDVVLRLAGKLPELQIVVDHLAGVRIDGQKPDGNWIDAMQRASRHKKVCCKISGLVEGTGRRGGKAPTETDYYKSILDVMWDLYGEERLIYGSNWPVCEHFATLETVQRIAGDYVAAKGGKAFEKVMSGNAQAVYRVQFRQ